jgi:hypothetical protein
MDRINPFNGRTPEQENRRAADDEWKNLISGQPSPEETRRADRIRRRRTAIGITIAIVAVLALSVGMFLAVRVTLNRKLDYNQRQSTSTSAPASPTVKPNKASPNGSFSNPAAAADGIGNAPTGDVGVSFDLSTMKFVNPDKTSSAVSFPSFESMKVVSEPCVLKSAAATCYIGVGKVGSADVSVYAFRNAKTSSLLYSSEASSSVPSNGAAFAYTQKVSANGKSQNGLFIVLKNQNGVLLTSSDGSALSSIASDSGKHFMVTESAQ